MMEVVKGKVSMLLDASIIYPISNSPQVSPVQCVPKKGGTTNVAPYGACRPWVFFINGVLCFLKFNDSRMKKEER